MPARRLAVIGNASRARVVLAIAIAGTLLAGPSTASAEGVGSVILFERSGDSGTTDLYSMDAYGDHESLFLADAADVDVARGGTMIAFDRAAATTPPDIFVAATDGTGVRQLTTHPGFDFWPDWSPDGRRITFTSDRGGKPDIYAMAPDGSDVRQLTDESNGAQGSEYSPNGQRILFVTFASGVPQIAVMDADGGERVVLTPGPDLEATWSPNGHQIAFISVRDGSRELYVMDADGANQTRLTNDANLDIGPPAFSPNGKEIAFMSRRGSNFDVHVRSLTSGEDRRLTDDPTVDGFPEWRQGAVIAL